MEILDCYPQNPPIPLVSLKVKQLNCIMMSYNKKNTPLKKYSCQKKSDLNLIKPITLAISAQKIRQRIF